MKREDKKIELFNMKKERSTCIQWQNSKMCWFLSQLQEVWIFSLSLTSSPYGSSYDNNYYCIYKPESVPQPLNLYLQSPGNLSFPMQNNFLLFYYFIHRNVFMFSDCFLVLGFKNHHWECFIIINVLY